MFWLYVSYLSVWFPYVKSIVRKNTLLLSCLDKEENVYRRMGKERHLLGGKGMLIFCCQIC